MPAHPLPAVFAASLIITPAAAATTPGHADRTAQRILDELRQAGGVPGLGAAIWHHGRIVWTGSSGLRDLDRRLPVDAKTKFRFASVSKLFAATAAARLREQGRLNVDAPVAGLLPYLRNGWPALTARQLAAHTAGIPHYQPIDAARGALHYPTTRDAVAIFANRALVAAPGTRYSYSSYGYTLLSAVIEQAGGKPYLAQVADLTNGLAIGPDATGSGDPDAARAYVMERSRPTPRGAHDYSYSWAGAGLGGTPSALAEWGGRVLSGRIVSSATLAWMAQPTLLGDGRPAADADYTVGFGWRTGTDLDGRPTMHHSGVTDGARSVLLLDPADKWSIGLLSNALWVASIERSALAIAAPFRPAPALAPRSCPLTARHYTGSYAGQSIAGTVTAKREAGICVATLKADNPLGAWLGTVAERDVTKARIVAVDPTGGLARGVLVTPIGAYEFRPAADGGYAMRFGATREFTFRFE